MGLEMKADCEQCGRKLEPEGLAYICTFECTFCADCTTSAQVSARIAAANWCVDRDRSSDGCGYWFGCLIR